MSTLTDPPKEPAATPPPAESPPPPGGETPKQTIAIPENWKESLDESFRNDPSLAAIKDVGSLAKSYINAQKLIGADKVPLPGKNATEEDWNNFFVKAGKPAKIEDYKLTLPKDAEMDEATLKQFQEIAFKNNVLPTQASKIVEWFLGTQQEQAKNHMASVKAEVAKQIDGLKKEWGPDFVAKTNIASTALKHYVGEDEALLKHIDDMGYGDDPAMLKLFAKIGEELKEHGFISGESSGKSLRTVAEIDNEISTHMNDPAYFSGDHPNHQKAVDSVRKLYEERAALGG